MKIRITGSTSNMVLKSLYPDVSTLLLRFEEVKAVACVADAERDRLRKYIQEEIPSGVYDNCVLEKALGTEQCYPNADGKTVLQTAMLIEESVATDAPPGTEVSVFTRQVTVDEILHQLQKGKDALEAWLWSQKLAEGQLLDNHALYKLSAPTNVKITLVPKEACHEAGSE